MLFFFNDPATTEIYTLSLHDALPICQADPRTWFSGDFEWKGSLQLPAALPPGKYDLFLDFPDKYPALAGRPEYSIRLANEGGWEANTGYNKLGFTLLVRPPSSCLSIINST